MGILSALDHHKALEVCKADSGPLVEYRLESWGEVFHPFFGDREHSVAARFILPDFPFKLFSSSTPHDDPLPQQLTLTFRVPHEVRVATEALHSSGIFPHEIAQEFAGFLSLVTRRRVFAVQQTRYDELPMLQESHLYQKAGPQERQTLKEIDPSHVYRLLQNLRDMERHHAEGLVLAMRLYHTAVQLMYAEPEFSYLLLIIAVEAASSVVLEDYLPAPAEDYLDSRYPSWREVATLLPTNEISHLTDLLLSNEHYTFQKLLTFVGKFLPDRFWDQAEDDAKPDYLFSLIGVDESGKGKLTISPSDKTLQPYELFPKEKLKSVLRNVYNARSRLVHSGVRLPPSIVLGHYRLIPAGAFDEIMESRLQDREASLDIPPLLTFERLVSLTLVNYLDKISE
jgi:hypothetical protein